MKQVDKEVLGNELLGHNKAKRDLKKLLFTSPKQIKSIIVGPRLWTQKGGLIRLMLTENA